ncbi:hypothetical protein [uncultured Bilophila sp.]|nr:hypothetical protein [uncultured Bilophila sp.]
MQAKNVRTGNSAAEGGLTGRSAAKGGLFHFLEKALWKRGIHDETLRQVLVWQIAAVLFTLTLGGALWAFHPVGKWLFWFGFGALLSAWNFYALIKFVPKIISNGWSKNNLMGLLIHTNMRLLFTGILLYMALVWWQGPLSAILSGLAALLVGMTAVGLKKTMKKPC